MSEILRLFVSATNDLESERAIVGRILAELPVKIGVEIRRTPASGGKYDDLSGANLTPAAQEFMRSTAPLNWIDFESTAQLAQIISLDLIKILDRDSPSVDQA